MQYIKDNELLKMNIIEDNSKEKHSPKIHDTINISSNAIYYYTLCNIIDNNYNVPYKIQQQLKTILRCVWHTLCSKIEYPDIVLFNDINKSFKTYLHQTLMQSSMKIISNDQTLMYKAHNEHNTNDTSISSSSYMNKSNDDQHMLNINDLFIKHSKTIINYRTNNVDQNTLLVIQYCLIPKYVYNNIFYINNHNTSDTSISSSSHNDQTLMQSSHMNKANDASIITYNNDAFDKYLYIFKNILLSNNITIRGNLKKDKYERIKAAQSKEEIREITNDYDNQVSDFKNDNIFKIVNYLNYLYYTYTANDQNTNDTSINEDHKMKASYDQTQAYSSCMDDKSNDKANDTSISSSSHNDNQHIINNVLRCLLLRYTNIEDGCSLSLDGTINYSKDVHLSELYKHDENDYRNYISNIYKDIKELMNIISSYDTNNNKANDEYNIKTSNDHNTSDTSIGSSSCIDPHKSCDISNDKANDTSISSYNINDVKQKLKQLLTIFYISIEIYKYQFMHNDLSTYINAYINVLLHDLTNHHIPIDEFINKLINDIINSYKIASIIIDDKDIIELVMKTLSFKKFTFKTKNIYNFIINNISKDIVEQSNITEVYNELIMAGDVCMLFNKLSLTKYNDTSKALLKYPIELLLKIFISNFSDVVGPYTPMILQYLLYGRTEGSDTDKRDYIYNNIVSKKDGIPKNAIDSYADMLACLLCTTNEERYYYILSDEYKPTLIIACTKYIQYMSFSTKKFIKDKANENKLVVKDTYSKFSLDNVIDAL